MSTPLFIIAQQRSGTNLLRRSLATTGCFHDLDEIFDPKKEVYWPFYQNQIRERPELSMPTTENQLDIFDRFLKSHLVSQKPFTLIDVKYNSTHVLDDLWHSPVTNPTFIDWLIHRQFPVIHLVRKNCLENYVSMAAGSQTRQWVVGNATEPIPPVRLTLDVDETVFQIRRREREIQRFRRFLADANQLEIEYESLIDSNGEFSQSVAGRLFEFVNLGGHAHVKVPTKKTGLPACEIIENWETEIYPALVQQGLEKYLSNGVTGPGSRKGGSPTARLDQNSPPIAIHAKPVLHGVPRLQRSEPKSKPVFVLAMQRSGTNLYRRSLATSGFFHDLNEIFDPYQESYWPYRERLVRQRPELALPTSRNQLEIFESFLDQALANEQPFSFIDVKYNSTHHLNKVWYHPGSRPLLIDWLIEQQCPVVHLVRNNIFENYVSNVVAYQSRVWLVEQSKPVSDFSVRLEAAETLAKIKAFETQIDVFRTWLQPTNHIELTYESLIGPDGGLSPQVTHKTCELIGIDEALTITIPTRKTGRSLSQMVENFETDIAPALIKNGYADWLTSKAA